MESRFPTVLKNLRKQRNINQTEMAKMLGISQRAYSHYETGEHEPSIDSLITLSEFFNLPIDVLVGKYNIPGISDLPQEERKKRTRKASQKKTSSERPPEEAGRPLQVKDRETTL